MVVSALQTSLVPMSPDDRIINGQVASENQFPYYAAILFRGNIRCGGSIIDERHILTAAHCFRDTLAHGLSRDILPNSLAVVVGTSDYLQIAWRNLSS